MYNRSQILVLTLGLVSLVVPHSSSAMDYGDTVEVRQNPSLDLGNVYSWYDSESGQIYAIATLGPTSSQDQAVVFSPKGKYRIQIDTNNDLEADLNFDFFFGGNSEYGVTLATETARGAVGTRLKTDHWQVFAGVMSDPAFGDYAGLNTFFAEKFACSPAAGSGIHCDSTAPANTFASKNTGVFAVSLSREKLGISAEAKVNVWATSWVLL